MPLDAAPATGDPVSPPAADVDQLIAEADERTAEGGAHEAIATLTAANRRRRDPALELALARIRHLGFDSSPHPMVARADGDDLHLDLVDGLPTIAPEDLSAPLLSHALSRYGCLFVPGLLDADQVDHAVDGIDRAFEELDRYEAAPLAARSPEERAWFEPFHAAGPYAGMELGGRSFTRSTGGIWTIESPRMLFDVLELFERNGVIDAVSGHLGERPVMSASKCNIRRTPPHIPGGWHQDGSFIGTDVSTVDAWVSLSHCGRDAAGLDVVVHPFQHLLRTGIDGVVIPHEVVLEAIAELGLPVISREYGPGDALLFDHLFVHRTAITPEMTRDRYALETWFFAPSRYPDSQIPFLY